MSILKLTFENLTPSEAADVLMERALAMSRGEVYVRPHFRKVAGWTRLSETTRQQRIFRYARRLTGDATQARLLTGLPKTFEKRR